MRSWQTSFPCTPNVESQVEFSRLAINHMVKCTSHGKYIVIRTRLLHTMISRYHIKCTSHQTFYWIQQKKAHQPTITIKHWKFMSYFMFLCRIEWCCSIIWTSAYMPLALLVLRPEHSGRTKPLPWLSMPWLLVSQSQQALCYWLHRINRSMCSMGKNSTACTISIHFSYHWPLLRGIHRWPVQSLHEDQQRRALMIFLPSARTNCWTNRQATCDLRHPDAHVISL